MMKRAILTVAFGLILGFVPALAGPSSSGLVSRILSIADPDQVQAFQSLNLTPNQLHQLQIAGQDLLPKVEAAQKTPGGHFFLLPEALQRVDSILTPAQRPLARKLIPRAHQWPKLKALYQDYR